MSVPAGKIMLVAGQYLIDRAQSATASRTTPKEVIKELGNEENVETIRDTPETSWSLDSFDTSVEFEAAMTRVDPTTVDEPIDLRDCKPIDITSPHKRAADKIATHGIALPHLALTSASYRFGVDANAQQQFQLVGDYEWPGPGTPITEEFDGAGAGPYIYDKPDAVASEVRGEDVFVLSVTVYRADGTWQRLSFDDYVSTATQLTLLDAAVAPVGSTISIVYFTDDLQEYLQGVHPTATVKPGAVKGKDILFYVGPQGGPLTRWRGMQNVEINWTVQATAEKEMGNQQRVATDYEQPEVAGQATMLPADLPYFYNRVAEVTGIPNTKVANLLNREILEARVIILHPNTGALLKGFTLEAVSFEAPPLDGRVNQKYQPVFRFDEDNGNCDILSPLAMAALGISA